MSSSFLPVNAKHLAKTSSRPGLTKNIDLYMVSNIIVLVIFDHGDVLCACSSFLFTFFPLLTAGERDIYPC